MNLLSNLLSEKYIKFSKMEIDKHRQETVMGFKKIQIYLYILYDAFT